MKKLLFVGLLPSVIFANTLQVFTVDSIPIQNDDSTNYNVSICSVDSYKSLTKELQSNYGDERSLSPDKKVDIDSFESNNKGLYDKILKSYQCRNQAHRYKLKKYPAFVFNDKYVVYGYDNISDSIDAFNQSSKK